jgi:glutamine amidotransferase
MIAIVDYGMGNIRSVEKAFHKIGVDARVTADAASVRNASGIVLPGVGAFRDCMANLDNLNLLDTIVAEVRKGKPYLGICLGLQILFSESEEFGHCKGLGVFPGRVVRFQLADPTLKIPHMGWNTVSFKKKPPICAGIPDRSHFYFVHSYYVVPENPEIIAGTTEYGIPFTSMVWKDHVMATQFHPEKSQDLGLRMLKGFADFVRSDRG